MTIDEALRTIIAASPAAAGDALSCIQAIRAKSPVVGLRFNRVVELAFTDPAATFTPAQRAAIAELIEIPDSGESRTITFRLRLTETERDALQSQADAAGLTMSEWARRRLFDDSIVSDGR